MKKTIHRIQAVLLALLLAAGLWQHGTIVYAEPSDHTEETAFSEDDGISEPSSEEEPAYGTAPLPEGEHLSESQDGSDDETPSEEGPAEETGSAGSESSSDNDGTSSDAGSPCNDDASGNETAGDGGASGNETAGSDSAPGNDAAAEESSPGSDSAGEESSSGNEAAGDDCASAPDTGGGESVSSNDETAGSDDAADDKTAGSEGTVSEPGDAASSKEAPAGDAASAKDPAEGKEESLKTEETAGKEAAPANSAASAEPVPFSRSVPIENIVVTVNAEAGAFPADSVLSVSAVPAGQQEAVEEAVEAVREESRNVAVQYTFDIQIKDPQGEELQPAQGKAVQVSFTLSEAADGNLRTDLYHISEEGSGQPLSAERLETEEEGPVVTAETDGFSFYVVEFTYGDLSYILPGQAAVGLSEILAAVGLSGEAEDVQISNSDLVSVLKENEEWVVTALQAFHTNEWLKVTISGIAYEITLTDSEAVEYKDTDKKNLDKTNVTYVIKGNGNRNVDGNYFTVPSGKSSSSSPITIILDNVNRSQSGKSPDRSFITIESGNYVIIKLRGTNYIEAGEDKQIGANDGMAAIHVSDGSTVKITSEIGDGSANGSLEARGGGGKYGGAGIGTRYNDDAGTIIIAGGTIRAFGGHSAAGIGSGRDGVAREIQILGGDIYAEGGQYAAGIGAGDHAGNGDGGNVYNITISGGKITAVGGNDPDGDLEGGAGIGASEGGAFKGTITINGGEITATGSDGAGIGGGNGYANTRVVIDQQADTLEITAAGGKNAAGIGAGDADAKSISITLRGGKIVARGGENGSGIGAGDNIESIDISGRGTIEAYGGKTAAGIGGGNDSGVTDHLTIEGDTTGYGSRGETIEGGRQLTITAVASYGTEPGNGYDNEGAAIGGGKATNGNITVKNAVLYTRADEQGADIGGGFHAFVGGTVDTISIDNCEIISSSKRKVAPGIGASYGGSARHIIITNTKYTGGGSGKSPSRPAARTGDANRSALWLTLLLAAGAATVLLLRMRRRDR